MLQFELTFLVSTFGWRETVFGAKQGSIRPCRMIANDNKKNAEAKCLKTADKVICLLFNSSLISS